MEQEQKAAILLTEAQVAERLQVSIQTMRRWRRESIGPPWHRAGRQIRYRPAEVDHWVEEQPR
jgi:predicted site-specific integrase-resolvase